MRLLHPVIEKDFGLVVFFSHTDTADITVLSVYKTIGFREQRGFIKCVQF